jgi:hypothetical protein
MVAFTIYGLDFTSAPRKRKPITCAACTLEGGLLRASAITPLPSFAAFEQFLCRAGPWIAGFDFPFGQPARLIAGLNWPRSWEGYVGTVAALSMQEFAATLARYREGRPPGDKQHQRATDALADSRSPMMLYGVPVGRMFFQGAPRLLRAGVSILPCRPTTDSRIAVEAYPALVARAWIGKQGYKHDRPAKQSSAHLEARRRIVEGVCSDDLARSYGLRLDLDAHMARHIIAEPTGDTLDALLCAIQAAWAWQQREQGYGIPATCDPLEGWIVDPSQRGHAA